MTRWTAAIGLMLMLGGCATQTTNTLVPKSHYVADLALLRQHAQVVELASPDGRARAAVVPAYQGRVMTSNAGGTESFGWVNRDLIASGKRQPHINAFGGEDRFWLGPEGGPYSIFFAKGAKQEFANWQTPAAIDTEPFDVVEAKPTSVAMRRAMRLTNASGTTFDVGVGRTVLLLDDAAVARAIQGDVPAGVRAVGFVSRNTITNAGREPWTKERGLLSIWILGMFKPSAETTVVVPIKASPAECVNDAYFGKVPAERLKFLPAKSGPGGTMAFSGDGQLRSKIGVSPKGAVPVMGSYDAAAKVLTIVRYSLPKEAERLPYVNSVWGERKDPYAGDVVNSYNDGPPAPGAKPMGPFYELESSSPGAALKPGESLTHTHMTVHVVGEERELDAIARRVLGVGTDQIQTVLTK